MPFVVISAINMRTRVRKAWSRMGKTWKSSPTLKRPCLSKQPNSSPQSSSHSRSSLNRKVLFSQDDLTVPLIIKKVFGVNNPTKTLSNNSRTCLFASSTRMKEYYPRVNTWPERCGLSHHNYTTSQELSSTSHSPISSICHMDRNWKPKFYQESWLLLIVLMFAAGGMISVPERVGSPLKMDYLSNVLSLFPRSS